MSWITFVWAMVIGACVVMALPHLLLGLKGKARANLFFVLAALSVGGIACGELAIMHSRSIEEIGRAIQWTHVPIVFLVLGIVGFVHSYFGTGRLWLGIAACGVRFVSLLINFALPPNLNFREITALRPNRFLGDTIALPEGHHSPWMRLGELSSLLLLAFVVDASLALWRRGRAEDRRRAAIVGGSIALFILLAGGLSALIHADVIKLPYLISFPFLGVIVAMGFELSYDILRAAQTASQLRVSEVALRESDMRMRVAVSAAKLGLWVWNIQRNDVWITPEGRRLFGFSESESLNLERFLNAIHEEDRRAVEAQIRASFVEGGDYEREYRVVLPDGETRWIAATGRLELDAEGLPALMRGVTWDITERRCAELEKQQLQHEIAHVGRVSMMRIGRASCRERV